jgi:hypothetical protein
MAKLRQCRWNCGRKTDRRCGICLFCCDERDRHNKAIDAGTESYIPPTKRPGHRFYERKGRGRTDKQKAAIESLNRARGTELAKQTA